MQHSIIVKLSSCMLLGSRGFILEWSLVDIQKNIMYILWWLGIEIDSMINSSSYAKI